MHKLNVRVVVLIWGQCYGFHKVHQCLAPMVNVVHALLLPQSLSGASHQNQQGTEWQNDITLTHAHKKQKQFFDSWSFLVFFYSLLAVVIFRSYKKYALKEIIWCIIFSGFLSFPLTLFSLMCLHEVQSAECFLSSVLLSFSSASKKSPSCHPLWLSVSFSSN